MITNKQKGLSVKGVKINVPIDQLKNNNISLLMAITTNGIIKTNISKDNTNSIIFFDFIKNIISDLTEDNYIFLFDNVPFHKNKEMLKYIEDNGHKYMFVPKGGWVNKILCELRSHNILFTPTPIGNKYIFMSVIFYIF